MNNQLIDRLLEQTKRVPGRRAFLDLNVLNTKEGSSSTYIVVTGIVAVPTSLKNHLTKRELFYFLQSRGLVAVNGVFVSSHFPASQEE